MTSDYHANGIAQSYSSRSQKSTPCHQGFNREDLCCFNHSVGGTVFWSLELTGIAEGRKTRQDDSEEKAICSQESFDTKVTYRHIEKQKVR